MYLHELRPHAPLFESQETSHGDKVGIVVGDPYPVVLYGLFRIIESDSRLKLVGNTTTFQNLRVIMASERPEIALLDWGMLKKENVGEVSTFIEAVSKYARILVMSGSSDTRESAEAFRFGVRGVISKDSAANKIRKALWKVHAGGVWIERASAEAMLHSALSPDITAQRTNLLTRRERDVVALVCDGLRNKEIAMRLNISETTVWHHLTSTFSKVGVSDRLGLVAYIYKQGHHTLPSRVPRTDSERHPIEMMHNIREIAI